MSTRSPAPAVNPTRILAARAEGSGVGALAALISELEACCLLLPDPAGHQICGLDTASGQAVQRSGGFRRGPDNGSYEPFSWTALSDSLTPGGDHAVQADVAGTEGELIARLTRRAALLTWLRHRYGRSWAGRSAARRAWWGGGRAAAGGAQRT